MKPGFALLLSRDGIGLLQRGSGGWLAVDEVSLDDPDLASKLDVIRKSAEILASEAGEPKLLTKLILPNSEILYEEVVLPQREDVEIEIERHLDGRTPYCVAELAYDYVVSDGLAQIAVVARETLEEAESFAVENGFNPVYFGSLPPAGSFTGEPMFGLTKAARSLLPQGIPVERGAGKIRVAGAVDLPDLPPDELSTNGEAASTAIDEFIPEFRSKRGAVNHVPTSTPELASIVPPRLNIRSNGAEFKSNPAPLQALSGAFSDARSLVRVKPVPAVLAAAIALCAVAGVFWLTPLGSDAEVDAVSPADGTRIALQAPAAPDYALPTLALTVPQSDSVPKTAGSEYPSRSASFRLAAVEPASPVQPLGFGPPVKSAPAGLNPVGGLSFEQALQTGTISETRIPTSPAAQLPRFASNSPKIPGDPGLPPVLSPETPAASSTVAVAPDAPDTSTGSDEPVPSVAMAALSPPADAPPVPGGEAPVSKERGAGPAPLTNDGSVEVVAKLTEPQRDLDTASSVPEILALAENLDELPDAATPPVAPNDYLRPSVEAEVVLVPTLSSEQLEQLAELRPSARPAGIAPPAETETAELDPALAQLKKLRPTARPSGLKPPKPTIQVAVNDAAEVPLAQRPKKRPSKIRQMAAQNIPQRAPKATPEQAAAAAAIVAPEKKKSYRREKTTVARRATMTNALPTSQVALIGVYGSDSKRRALVRLPSGRYVKVNVGDRVDGGKVSSIGRNSIKFVKGGRSRTLKVPES